MTAEPHAGRRVTIRIDRGLLQLVDDGVLLRSLPNPLTPAELARIRDARPAGPPPQPPVAPLRVQRRISCRGALAVAGQRIHVGMVHAGRTVTVETGDTTWRIYHDDELLTEVARTSTKPIARFKARKPEPARRTRAAKPVWKSEPMPVSTPPSETFAAATSPDWSTRAAAGQHLAAWADRDDIAAILQRLLQDRGDTAVVEATCLALLRRNDIHGTRLVARATTTAQGLLAIGLDHLDHLHDAVTDYLFPDGPVDDLLALCDALASDPDPTTASGATRLANWARPASRPTNPASLPNNIV